MLYIARIGTIYLEFDISHITKVLNVYVSEFWTDNAYLPFFDLPKTISVLPFI